MSLFIEALICKVLCVTLVLHAGINMAKYARACWNKRALHGMEWVRLLSSVTPQADTTVCYKWKPLTKWLCKKAVFNWPCWDTWQWASHTSLSTRRFHEWILYHIVWVGSIMINVCSSHHCSWVEVRSANFLFLRESTLFVTLGACSWNPTDVHMHCGIACASHYFNYFKRLKPHVTSSSVLNTFFLRTRISNLTTLTN